MLLANKQRQQPPLTCPVVDRRRVVGGERKAQILTFSYAGRGGKRKGKFDSCHHNSVKLGVTFKIMPLNGMDFNMKSNFKKL